VTAGRLRAWLGIAVTSAGALAPAAPAAADISLSATRDAKFPERAYVITLPEKSRLAKGQVTVRENGGPVEGLRVSAVGAARRAKLGVVLAIDASTSVRGGAYESAFEAARAFARERVGRQPLALVTFSNSPSTVMPFTAEESRIDEVLGNPGIPSGGTHMYDAALRSIELVKGARLPGGYVVVLSDGADHGSAAGIDDVVHAARAANVRIYTVGLESDRFDPEALAALAEGGGGTYWQATSVDELEEVYRVLGAQISNAHQLTYRSLVRPNRNVDVDVTVAGLGSASASYRSPKLSVDGSTGTADGGVDWGSPLVLALAIALVVGLLLAATVIVARGRRLSARDRVAQFVSPVDADGPAPTLSGRLAAGAERSLGGSGWWERFAAEMDVGGVRQSPGHVVIGAIVLAASLLLVGGSASGSGAVGLALALTVFVGVWAVVHRRAQKQRRLFADQLADHLAVVGGSLRVGHSLPAALSSTLDEAPEPARREFERVMTDEKLGKPLEDALEEAAQRMRNRELEHVALLAKLQREVGADAAEMVDQVVATVRERQELRRAVRTLTAQGRFSQLILSALPIASLAFLTLTYRDYVDPLYETSVGRIILGASAVMVVAGSLIIRRIVTFKV